MAVQVWIGEKPEHPNERRAIVALAKGLDQLEGLYIVLANFNVGGRSVDLVVMKNDGIFIIELKHCDGRVIGSVNGPWFVEGRNGERKRINPGRRNPYNQVISYFHAFTNFLNAARRDFLSEQKAAGVDFRTCRRAVVIAPSIAEDSEIETDWKVDLKGLDELPAYLVTERSTEVSLSDEEMQAIPVLLNCSRWQEINTLIGGALPDVQTAADPETAPLPTQPEPSQAAAVAAPPLSQRVRAALMTTTGRIAALMSLLAVALFLVIVLAPPRVTVVPADQPVAALTGATDVSIASELAVTGGFVDPADCTWSGQQVVAKRWDAVEGLWLNLTTSNPVSSLDPEVIVSLKQVNYCSDTISLTWSLRNQSSADIAFPLLSRNIQISDGLGNDYVIEDARSLPAELRVAPGDIAEGIVVVPRAVSRSASSLIVRLSEEPFGEASFVVPLLQP